MKKRASLSRVRVRESVHSLIDQDEKFVLLVQHSVHVAEDDSQVLHSHQGIGPVDLQAILFCLDGNESLIVRGEPEVPHQFAGLILQTLIKGVTLTRISQVVRIVQ